MLINYNIAHHQSYKLSRGPLLGQYMYSITGYIILFMSSYTIYNIHFIMKFIISKCAKIIWLKPHHYLKCGCSIILIVSPYGILFNFRFCTYLYSIPPIQFRRENILQIVALLFCAWINIQKQFSGTLKKYVCLPHRTIAVIILQINVVFRLLNSDVYQPIDCYDGIGFCFIRFLLYWQMEKFVKCKTIQFSLHILELSLDYTSELFFSCSSANWLWL